MFMNEIGAHPLWLSKIPAICAHRPARPLIHGAQFVGTPPRAPLDSGAATRQFAGIEPEDAATMTKPAKTEAELVAMAVAELKVHADVSEGIRISVIKSDDSWEFRASADAATVAKPGYPEAVAMLVQIGDHLGKQYDLKG